MRTIALPYNDTVRLRGLRKVQMPQILPGSWVLSSSWAERLPSLHGRDTEGINTQDVPYSLALFQCNTGGTKECHVNIRQARIASPRLL